MISLARATCGRRLPSLDVRSGKRSSPPSREEIQEGRSLDTHMCRLTGPIPKRKMQKHFLPKHCGYQM